VGDKTKKSKQTKPKMKRIGVVDTMFARFNMGAAARSELAQCPGAGVDFEVISRTVPGFKDLAVAAKRLIEHDYCDIVLALGMAGAAPIDKQCAHEAALGITWAELLTSTPILEVFVHEDESDDVDVLNSVFDQRSRKHARNAYWMLFEPDQLVRRAGLGIRQGFEDAGPLTLDATL
jgi:riboflavin synthase